MEATLLVLRDISRMPGQSLEALAQNVRLPLGTVRKALANLARRGFVAIQGAGMHARYFTTKPMHGAVKAAAFSGNPVDVLETA